MPHLFLSMVDETIEEADAGANKINELMAYFKNVVKKCVNSVAVMIVTTFVLPMLTMLLFRWLLTDKNKILTIACYVLGIAIVVMLLWGLLKEDTEGQLYR